MFKNNFYRLNYLSKCDLLNKYLLKNTYSYPKVDSISLNVSLANLLIAQNDRNELQMKIRTFMIFFLFTFNLPFLKYSNFIKYNKMNYTSNVTDFKIFINLSKKRIINSFLISLFIENIDNLKIDNNLISIKSFFLNSSNILKIRLILPLINLYNFFYLTDSSLFSVNTKEISIFMDIILKNKNFGNKHDSLKNLLFFWLI